MTRIVTAAFHDAEAATRAQDALRRLGVRHVRLHDAPNAPVPSATPDSIGGERGLPALLDALFLPNEDFAAHREAMDRGGVVLSAEVEERQAAEAVRLLDEAGARDLDQESQGWRAEGWKPTAMAGAVTARAGEAPAMMPGTGGLDAEAMRMIAAGSYAANTTGTATPGTAGGTRDPRRLLRREPGIGRARSYVIEAPLAEQRDPARPGEASNDGLGGPDRGAA